jgi:DNA excision repair protein ERCC-5
MNSASESPDIIDVDESSVTKEVVDLEKDEEEEKEEEKKSKHRSSNLSIQRLLIRICRKLVVNLFNVLHSKLLFGFLPPRREHSPSPEFEDVVPQVSNQGPEIAVVSHQKASHPDL